MSTTFTWKIDKAEKLSDGFITKVAYSVTATDGEKSHTIANEFVMVKSKEDQEFKPFESLSESTVLGWVYNHVDKAALESKLQSKLKQETTTEVSTFPWSPVIEETEVE